MANGNGKWQMPTAECKIGANRNLSKDLAMFHADFTLARSHTLAGQWKLVAKSIFPYNRKSSAVSATSGVPLLFFFRFCFVFFLLFSLDRGAFPTAPKSRKSRRADEKPEITFTRLELTFATATPPAADQAQVPRQTVGLSLSLPPPRTQLQCTARNWWCF